MFDLSLLAAKWKVLVAQQVPCAAEELFKAKLARAGIKAPFGTPAAKAQLAKAIAKSYANVGGSGSFMGEPLNQSGVNHNVIRAELMVGQNVSFSQASAVADKLVI